MSALVERLRSALGDAGLEVPAGDGVPLARPASEDEARAVVRVAAEEGVPLLPMGAGTKAGWTHPAEGAGLVLSTQRLTGIVSYEPEDGTVTARAGTPMDELRATVAAGGHHLSPEVPTPDGQPSPTLGGVISAAQSGLDRGRFGPVRNVLLGTRAIYADGASARSGGQLVKNVTGYDLHKLHCGAHGALCLLTEASLRLFPSPREQCAVQGTCEHRGAALEAAARVRALPVRPHAVVASEGQGAWTLTVVLAGLAQAVEWERAQVMVALPDFEATDGAAAAASLRADLRDGERGEGRWPELLLSSRPSRMLAALDALEEAAGALELETRATVHPGIARAAISVRAKGGAPLSLGGARELHARMAPGPARLAWRAAPAGLATEVDLFGPPSAGTTLMRRLKDALDPGGVFPRGRTHGRI